MGSQQRQEGLISTRLLTKGLLSVRGTAAAAVGLRSVRGCGCVPVPWGCPEALCCTSSTRDEVWVSLCLV